MGCKPSPTVKASCGDGPQASTALPSNIYMYRNSAHDVWLYAVQHTINEIEETLMRIEEYWDAAAKRHGIDNQKAYGFERPDNHVSPLSHALERTRFGVEQGWTYKLDEDKNALWEIERGGIAEDYDYVRVRKVDQPIADKIMTALQEAITKYQQANAS